MIRFLNANPILLNSNCQIGQVYSGKYIVLGYKIIILKIAECLIKSYI